MEMQHCWSFTCCLSLTFDSLLKYSQLKVFSIGITLTDVHLNRLNWFKFPMLKGDLLVILIDWMIFLSSFLDATTLEFSVYRTLSFDLRSKWLVTPYHIVPVSPCME